MDFVAELRNAAFEPMDYPLFLPFREGGSATLLVHLGRLEQGIDNHEYLMRYRDDRFLLAAPPCQTMEIGCQKAILSSDCCPRCLHQGRAQIAIAITNAR